MNKLNKVFKLIGIFLLFLFFSSIFFIVLNIDTKNISDMKYIIYLSISNLILLSIYIYIYHKDVFILISEGVPKSETSEEYVYG